MKHLREWQRRLAKSRSKAKAADLAVRMHARYESLHQSHAHITSRPLRTQLTGLILPGLSLYQTLLEDLGNDRQATLAETEALFHAELFKREQKLIPLLNYIPSPFPLLRPALRQMCRNIYLPGSTEVVEDSPDCFAVNTHRCFTLDMLTDAGAPELAPLYCKTDDWLAELLPKVRWLRTGTLALGADVCDFRWRRNGK